MGKQITEEKCNDSDKTLLSSSNFISGYRKLFPLTQAFFFNETWWAGKLNACVYKHWSKAPNFGDGLVPRPCKLLASWAPAPRVSALGAHFGPIPCTLSPSLAPFLSLWAGQAALGGSSLWEQTRLGCPQKSSRPSLLLLAYQNIHAWHRVREGWAVLCHNNSAILNFTCLPLLYFDFFFHDPSTIN